MSRVDVCIIAISCLTLTAACQGNADDPVAAAAKPAATQPTAAQSQPAVAADLSDGLQRAITRVRQQSAGAAYRLTETAGGFMARNEAHGLEARFSAGQVQVAGQDGAWRLGLRVIRWGRRGDEQEAAAPAASAQANRLALKRGAMEEWYLNGPVGLEQGFTVSARPAGSGALVFEMTVTGDLEGRADEDGRSVTFHSLDGEAVAIYRDLWALDADGRELPARMAHARGLLTLEIDDAGSFRSRRPPPLPIQPLLW